MRIAILTTACLLAACGPSEVEVAEAERAKARSVAGSASPGEAPVDLGDGLILTVLARGSGGFVTAGGRVRVHYTADVVAVGEPEPEADARGEDSAGEPAAEQPAATDSSPESPAGSEAPPGAETSETSQTPVASDAPVSSEPPAASETSEAPAATEQSAAVEGQDAAGAAEAPASGEAPAQAQGSDAAVEEVGELQAPGDAPAADALPRRFDSSRARGVPDDWDLSRTARPRLIEGLRRGLVGLTAGSRVTLYVPADLAWGDEGLPDSNVPPRADVLYEIELLEVLP